MIAAIDSPVEATKPVRSRSPRKAPGQSTSRAVERLPKSRDSSMVKSTFYVPSEVAKKLVVASVIRGCDTSDIVAEVLAKALSSIAYYEKPAKPALVSPDAEVIGVDSAD